MTVKGKAKTPQPSKALQAVKAVNQKTPQSAPPKSKGTPGGKGKKDMTPLSAKTQKLTPKQLVSPKSSKSTPKSQKNGKKTPQSKKAGSEDDEDDEEDFITGDEDDDLDMDDEDMSDDEELPEPVQRGAKKNTPAAKGKATPKTATPAKETKTPKVATPAAKTPKVATPAAKTPKVATPAAKTPKVATPAPKAAKTPKVATPAVKATKTPKKDAVTTGESKLDLVHEIQKDQERRDDRDKRTLFVKGFPESADEASMKSLSKDIESVRMRPVFRRGKRVPSFAFLVFKTQDLAKKNHKKLQGHKVEDRALTVDFVGEASEFKPEGRIVRQLKPDQVDPLKLYVSGFSGDVKAEDLKTLFPNSCDVSIPGKPKSQTSAGYAFIEFTSEDLALAAHDAVQGKVFRSRTLTVMFAKRKVESMPTKRKSDANKKKAKKQQVKAKKAKTGVEEDKGDDLDDIDFDSDDDDVDDDGDEEAADIDDDSDDDDDDDDDDDE